MKKTLSLSLGGRVFAFEEDAYARLSDYLAGLKDRFRGEPAVAELLNDIESSLAEKCTQRIHPYKEAVTLADVEEIIAVMGDVDEIADEDRPASAESVSQTEAPQTPKRLYRDAEDVVVAGVCAGLAAYLAVDPLYVRLGFIILTLLNGIGFVLYGILWLVVPRALTPVQKLEMHGRPTNLNELQERVRQKAADLSQEGRLAWKRLEGPASPLRRLLGLPIRLVAVVFGFLKAVILAIGPIIRILAGATLTLFATLGIAGVTMLAAVLAFRAGSPYLVSDVPLAELAQNPLYYLGIAALFVFFAVPLFLIALLGATILRRKSAFRSAIVAFLVAFWIVAAGTAAVVGVELVPWVSERVQQQRTQDVTTRAFPQEGVNALVIGGQLRLKVVRGDVPALSLRGRSADLDALLLQTQGGTLMIDQRPFKAPFCLLCGYQPIEGTVTLPVLDSVRALDFARLSLSGFTEDLRLDVRDGARVESVLFGQSATATVSDVARLELTGTTTRLRIDAQDAAHVEVEVGQAQEIVVKQKDVTRVQLKGKTEILRADLQDAARLEAADLLADRVEVSAQDVGRADLSPLRDFMATSTDASRILHGDLAPTSAYQDDHGRIERRNAAGE